MKISVPEENGRGMFVFVLIVALLAGVLYSCVKASEKNDTNKLQSVNSTNKPAAPKPIGVILHDAFLVQTPLGVITVVTGAEAEILVRRYPSQRIPRIEIPEL